MALVGICIAPNNAPTLNEGEQMPDENLLLEALPRAERQRLDPFLESVYLEVGHPVTVPGEPIPAVYFPFDAVTSTVQEMSDGDTIETGLMGLEGLAGVQLWLRQRSTIASTFVQVPGRAMRMTADDFVREIRDRPSPMNDLIAGYVHSFLVLTSLTAACNRLHSVDERLCRWLSMTYKRAQRREFPMRHEFLAQMLGVHRPTLSTAANMLQKAGIISYHYGNMTIIDPEGLAQGACECHQTMEREFQKIFQSWEGPPISQSSTGRRAT